MKPAVKPDAVEETTIYLCGLVRRTFSSELGHDNKSEVMCMCPINSAVVRAFRLEARAKTGEVSPLTIGGCARRGAPRRKRTVNNAGEGRVATTQNDTTIGAKAGLLSPTLRTATFARI